MTTSTQDASSWIWQQPNPNAETGHYQTINGVQSWFPHQPETEPTGLSGFPYTSQQAPNSIVPPDTTPTTTEPASVTFGGNTNPIPVVTSVTGPTSILTQTSPGLVFGSITQARVTGPAGTTYATVTNANGGAFPIAMNTRTAFASTSRSSLRCSGKGKGRCKGKGKGGRAREQSYEVLASPASHMVGGSLFLSFLSVCSVILSVF